MGHSGQVAPLSAPLALLILLGGMLAGCNPKIDQSPAETEIFHGRFILEKDPNTIGGSDTDQVEFVVQGGIYSFQYLTFNTKLCDSKGNAEGFGANRVNFVPTTVFVGNCDSIDVPRGYFISAFKGDSLYLTKFDTSRNHRYQIDLTK
jgi:hypothetical protein